MYSISLFRSYAVLTTAYSVELLIGAAILSPCLASLVVSHLLDDSISRTVQLSAFNSSLSLTLLLCVLKVTAVVLFYNNSAQLRRMGSRTLFPFILFLTLFNAILATILLLGFPPMIGIIDVFALLLLLCERGAPAAMLYDSLTDPVEVVVARRGPDVALNALVKALALAGGLSKGTTGLGWLCAWLGLALLLQATLTLLLLPACVQIRRTFRWPLFYDKWVSHHLKQTDSHQVLLQRRAKLMMLFSLSILQFYCNFWAESNKDFFHVSELESTPTPNDDPWWCWVVRDLDKWVTLPCVCAALFMLLFGECSSVDARRVECACQTDQWNSSQSFKSAGKPTTRDQATQVCELRLTRCVKSGRQRAFSESHTNLILSELEKCQSEAAEIRSTAAQMALVREHRGASLRDDEILQLLRSATLKSRDLEEVVGASNLERAVHLRRRWLAELLPDPKCLANLAWHSFAYKDVYKRCCEEVIGYAAVPLGVAGPLWLREPDSDVVTRHYLPMATTEGCLIASTSRGCNLARLCGGVVAAVTHDGMSRAPVLRFVDLAAGLKCRSWLKSNEGWDVMRTAFESTSCHIALTTYQVFIVGREMHLRFVARTGEAMGMNMVTKACAEALRVLCRRFPHASVVTLSGNMCTDKKPSAANLLLGRGKSVSAELWIPGALLQQVLKVTPQQMASLCASKNLVGSALAGSVGGQNAHAANPVSALFLATGQDLAQVVDASQCLTWLQWEPLDDVLYCSVTMPALEVATHGGGTQLAGQRSALDLLDLDPRTPSQHLARVIVGAVLCCELSLMAAQITGDLVDSHMRLNRCTQKDKQAAARHPLT